MESTNPEQDPADLGPQASLEQCFENKEDICGFGDNLGKDTAANRTHYDSYASKYDKIQEVTGFNDPSMIVKYLVDNNVRKESKIIDFGCGTGILGVELYKAGYKTITGVDGSPQMLEEAMKKKVDGQQVYQNGYCCLIGAEALEGPEDGVFDIAVSSACMIKGHFPNNCFDTFLQFMKVGALMVFSIRDIYINSETDSGMNYHGALAEREKS